MFDTWTIDEKNGQLTLTFHPQHGLPRRCGDGPAELLPDLLAFVADAAAEADIILVLGRIFVKQRGREGAA